MDLKKKKKQGTVERSKSRSNSNTPKKPKEVQADVSSELSHEIEETELTPR